MLAKERQDKIYEIIKNDGAVETSKLAELFEVSIETIRKDFLVLERSDKLSRTHGGAVARIDMKPRYHLSKRYEECSHEKRTLSLKAIEFVSEGDIIGVDEGSTALAFAKSLKENFSNLTVVTYSLDVFHALCEHKDFAVILCGGYYMKSERAFFGSQTLDALSNLHIQKAFVFPMAISLESGICGYDDNLLQLQKQLIKSSDRVFMLADSSKFEKKALLKLSNTDEKYYYITDSNLSEELRKKYVEKNLKLFLGSSAEYKSVGGLQP